MLKLGKLFVLLIYVLGAHALPLAHQLEHVRQFHQSDAQVPVELRGGDHQSSCAGHHHFPRLGSRTQLTRLAANDANFVASQTLLEHQCGPACATCLASKAPCGFTTLQPNVFGERSPFVVLKPIESARLLSRVCGNLPGQRGPPVVVGSKSFLT